MVENILSFGAGFVTGCLYASYRFEKNPNQLIKMAGDDAKAAGNKIVSAAGSVKDGIANAINDIKMNKQVNGVSAPEVETPVVEVVK